MVIGDLESTSYASPTYNAVPAFCNRDESTQQKRLTLELLHARLGHRRCRTILAAHEHKLWADSRICMSPEPHCLSCGIATVRSAPLNKEHHTAAERPGEYVFLDILHPVLATGLTPASTYAFYLIIVDAYSRYVLVHGIPNKSIEAVIQAIEQYQADNKPAQLYGYVNLTKIWSDAGSQFTSREFADFCRKRQIHLSLAAPKKQYQNHLAERTWQTLSNMAHSLLIHSRLPDTFWYHTLNTHIQCSSDTDLCQ